MPVGMSAEFFVAFVVGIQWLEERDGVGDVNHDWDAKFAGGGP